MSLITWNPLDKYAGISLLNNNMTAKRSSSSNMATVRATEGFKYGMVYFEMSWNIRENPDLLFIGIANKKVPLFSPGNFVGSSNINSIAFRPHSGRIFFNSVEIKNELRVVSQGEILGIGVDYANRLISFYDSFGFIADADISLPISQSDDGLIYPAISILDSDVTVNFGAKEFDIVQSNPILWKQLIVEGYVPYDIDNSKWFNQIDVVLQDDLNKVISRDINGWTDTTKTTIDNATFSSHGLSLGDISGLSKTDWQSLYTSFTPPFKFYVFKEEDAISQPKIKATYSQNDYTVARSYEVEISETDLQKVKSLSIV